MTAYRTQTSVQNRRLRLGAAAGGISALLLVTGCGPSGETPEAAPAVTEEAEAAAGSAAESAGNAMDEAVTIDQPAGGQTQLTLDQGFLDTLRTLQVDVQPVAPATMEGNTLTFPVSGGNVTVDPGGSGDRFMGMLQHEGGLELSALGRTVQFTNPMLNADSGQLTAEFNGRTIDLFSLGEGAADVARRADEVMVSEQATAFSQEAVQALTEQLGLPPISLPEANVGQFDVMLPTQG